jgi:hypothetical protein
MYDGLKLWIIKGKHKCPDCGEMLTQIEEQYCEVLHTAGYLCVNCLPKKYYLAPLIISSCRGKKLEGDK